MIAKKEKILVKTWQKTPELKNPHNSSEHFKMQRRKQAFKFSEQNHDKPAHTTPRLGESSVRGKYQQQYKKYLQYEFTYSCYELVNKVCQESSPYAQLQGLPLKSLLLSTTKTLFMNELQLLFLSCLLSELQWPIFDDAISNYAPIFKSSPFTQDMRIRCLQLYLLFAGFSVKVYLNDNVKVFESEMLEMLPDFSQVFQSWTERFAKEALRINPLMLNNAYTQCLEKPRQFKQTQYQDLNNKVALLVENMPVPEPDSDYVKEEYIEEENDSVWPTVVYNENNIETELKMIEELPILVSWPFRSDSVVSGTGHSKGINWENWNSNLQNIPMPTLAKRFSSESDGFHQ